MKIKVFRHGSYFTGELEGSLNEFLEEIEKDYVVLKIKHTSEYTFIHYVERSKTSPPINPSLSPKPRKIGPLMPTTGPETTGGGY